MACFQVIVEIEYQQKGAIGDNVFIQPISSCRDSPFSIGLDRSEDAFYLYFNGGKEALETNWANFDLISSRIVSLHPCTGCVPGVQLYDCINGACTAREEYNTPGLYETIEECEVACGVGCSGKCLSNSDWATIQDLAKKLKNQNCN